MDAAAELQTVVHAFSTALKDTGLQEAANCCLVAFPRIHGPTPLADLWVIASAYQDRQSTSLPHVLELPDYVAVVLYCTARTRAFVPAGVDCNWVSRNVRAENGRALSNIVKRHGRALDIDVARGPPLSPQSSSKAKLPAALSPSSQRYALQLESAASAGLRPGAGADARAGELWRRVTDVEVSILSTAVRATELLQRVEGAEASAHAAGVCAAELSQRVAEAEAGTRAALTRAAAAEERCRVAEAGLLSLRAELQFVRATATAGLAAAQRRATATAETYPRS
jgi:hypothetical protein